MSKNNSKAEFSTPEKVADVCKRMQDTENERATDRSQINVLFNGSRPYTKAEEEKYQIQININWGVGPRIMQDANRQLNNALLHTGTLFNCALEEGKLAKRDEWSQVVTKNIHIPLQRGSSGRRHHFLIRSRNATIAMHGIGALYWPNGFRWLARYVPLEDLLIPSDTYCDLSNLRYFAVNLYLSPGELADMTQTENRVKGWNDKLVKELLDENRDKHSDNSPSNWRDQPEAMQEIQKQNRGYNYSDAVPKIKLRAFFFQEIDKPNKWYRHIVIRETMSGGKSDGFLYDGTGIVFADHIDHILNLQYGDSSLVAPLKYHSVRGLGVPLFGPVETLNRMQCEFVQHVFENLKMYFKINDPSDRDRLKQVVLQQYGFIPEGLSIVPQQERHMVDNNLVVTAMSQIRQIMQENSASFVQDIDKSSGKEMTAFEARARLNQVNVMVSGMLQMLYLQETFYYEEMFRRFCQKDSDDDEVKEFRSRCEKQGVPPELLVPKKWKISPERVLGGGDRTLAQVQAQWLLEHKTLYDPAAQQKILREATATMLDDPAKGQLYVPPAPVTVTDGTLAAENVFGTLMQGIETSMREGIDQIGYIEALLKMMASVVMKIKNTDNIGSIEDLIGLQTCAKNVGQHLMVLASDESEKQRVRQYGDTLGQIMNEIKGFAQRLMESQEQQAQEQQGDPQAQATAQSTMMLAQVKAQIAEQSAAMKARHKEIAFQQEQARRQMETLSETKREDLRTRQDTFNKTMAAASKTLSDTRSARAKAVTDIAGMKAKNKVDTSSE